MPIRWNRRRLVTAALIGVVLLIGVVALWRVMRPKDDPRLYGRWRLGDRGSLVVLGPGGRGSMPDFPGESLSWSINDATLYLENLPRSFTDGLRAWMDQWLGGKRPLYVFTIVEIRSDVVVLKKDDGHEFRMTRQKPPESRDEETRAIETPAE